MSATPTTGLSEHDGTSGHQSRRRILGLGLTGAAAGAFALSGATPATALERGRGYGQGNGHTAPVVSWVDIHEYASLVPNRHAAEADWDWTAAVQTAIDENQGRVVYFPNTAPRYLISDYVALRERTTLVGDGDSRIYFTISLPDAGDIHERGGFFRLREQKVIDDPTGAFSYDITVRDLTFESVEQQRAGAFKLVNARRVTITGCTFVNCGGVFVCHELEMNGAYDRGDAGTSGDPAVEAGFSPDSTDDLCEDVRFTDNRVEGQTYFVMAVRLNFVKRAVVTGNICRWASISWWGGGARKGEGGELRFLRRCRQFTIANNYLSWNNGSIYGNNGTDLTITGNVCEYAVDVGIDMEGCTHYVVDGNVCRYAGNFCYAVLYASDNGVFSNNVAIQGRKAEGIGDIAEQMGKHVFRRVAQFEDDRPHQFALRGNTFVWEDDTGFGSFGTASEVQAEVTGNHFVNVVVEGFDKDVPIAQKYDETFHDNDLRFTNASKADDVYVQLGDQRPEGASVLSVKNNTLRIENADPAAIPLVVQQGNPGKNKLTVVAGNVIDAATDIAIAYVDWADASESGHQYFDFADNKVRGGGIVANLSTHPDDGGARVRGDQGHANNTTFDLTPVRVDQAPDRERFGALHFGPDVG
ncbi:NosD domain-containing protein [Isoptericola sp. BMS4]|uniref:NosD domain-containing protein n=1 Tax=Isoptericola sp. BMS4 TaxID=2527875 RepID=UPI001420E383|nr:NosD domain-containing protein [Isoptericola sp. BMS4]